MNIRYCKDYLSQEYPINSATNILYMYIIYLLIFDFGYTFNSALHRTLLKSKIHVNDEIPSIQKHTISNFIYFNETKISSQQYGYILKQNVSKAKMHKTT